MRAVLVGVVGVALLLAGAVAGVAGTALLVTHPCSESYRLALQPAGAVDDLPESTTTVEDLSGVQRAAVEAALDNRTDAGFRDREALAALTDDVVAVDGRRYVPRLLVVECSTPYDEVAFAGYTGGLLGAFLGAYALLVRRLS